MRTIAQYLQTILSCFIAIVLLVSFGLHTVDVHHTHLGTHVHEESSTNDFEGDTTLSEYMHASEKYLFLLVLIAFLSLGLRINFLPYGYHLETLFASVSLTFYCIPKKHSLQVSASVFWLLLLYASGYLNPKIYRPYF